MSRGPWRRLPFPPILEDDARELSVEAQREILVRIEEARKVKRAERTKAAHGL